MINPKVELALKYPLARCPFCGKGNVRLCFNATAEKYGRGWFISHGGKACILAGVQTRGFATPDEAAMAWNRGFTINARSVEK